MTYVIKAPIEDVEAEELRFEDQKSMYGGRSVRAGDLIYLFASETQGGRGLIARGVVVAAGVRPRGAGPARQTPRLDLLVRTTGRARRPLGRAELRGFRDWGDGEPQTELNFKLYRQATNKVIAVSDAAARFLEEHL